MGKISSIGGLRLKLLALLLAFALVPLGSLGVFSLMEMNQAAKDVQEKVSGLSSTLNRSTLTAASNEADQVQIALAKANQYDEFFRRIKSENEIVANYASISLDNQSCDVQAGIWIAPLGANETLLNDRKQTLSSLCAPARVLRSVVEAEPACTVGYIGTEDGVQIIWPEIRDMLASVAPYDHRDKPWYLEALNSRKTAWTKPYIDSKGSLAITCATPIYRGDKLFGVAGLNISLDSVYGDLSLQGGRGYPFIIDESGTVIMRSPDRRRGEQIQLFASENFYESNSSDIRELVRNMLHGETGSAMISLGKTDGYVAFAPVATLGWSFGIAYPAEEMSLPARFIDAGIRNTAKTVTQGLTEAVRITWISVAVMIILTGLLATASGILISRKIEVQARNINEAADRIRNGDLDISEVSAGELGIIGDAFSNFVNGIKLYLSRQEATAEERGLLRKELEVRSEIKRNLKPAQIPHIDGYEIAALFMPSDGDEFDFYEILEVEDEKIALAMAEVSGGGVTGAMLAVASRALIRSSSENANPAKALSEVNLQIGAHAQGMNLACFYAVLDTVNHTLEFVNAAFNPAFIVDSGGSVDTLGGGGIALGVLDRLDLRPERIPVQHGDVLMVYSDGVTEATNAWRKQQGAERLITIVKENRSNSASVILAAIEKEIRSYAKDYPLRSDSTLVFLKRL
jgi:sigma-B regulation protein RsbU (phosphoserine phosphatase)